jgi:hypothetical protein
LARQPENVGVGSCRGGALSLARQTEWYIVHNEEILWNYVKTSFVKKTDESAA